MDFSSPQVIKVLLLKWVFTIVGIYIIRLFFRHSFKITGIAPIITVAIVIAPINVFIHDIAALLALPQHPGVIIGLLVVLNAVIIYIASSVVPYFYVENFPVALTVSVCLAGLSFLLAYLFEHYFTTTGATFLFP